MKKKLGIDGEKVRRERERRALTQEQLSERSQVAVRTLRRLEAGSGSLESLRRVAEALESEPEQSLLKEPAGPGVEVPFDTIRVEVSSDLLGNDPEAFLDSFVQRVDAVRRNIARQRGLLMPAVRFRDINALRGTYRIFLRNVLVAKAEVRPGMLLAVEGGERLAELRGEATIDPVYGSSAVWISSEEKEAAQQLGCTAVDVVQLMATHLFHLVRRHAHWLLGIEGVAVLLDNLRQPHLVAEVVPGKISLSELRSILCALLEEGVTLIDLSLILETIADHPGTVPERVEHVRKALRDFVSSVQAESEIPTS